MIALDLQALPHGSLREVLVQRACTRRGEPWVVPLLAVCLHGGELLLAMELMRRSLSDAVHGHDPMTPEQALRALSQVARAMRVLHAEGVVHRDLKPGNVLLDQEGNARVADVGLATLGASLGRSAGSPSAATGSGDEGSSWKYMSPE